MGREEGWGGVGWGGKGEGGGERGLPALASGALALLVLAVVVPYTLLISLCLIDKWCHACTTPNAQMCSKVAASTTFTFLQFSSIQLQLIPPRSAVLPYLPPMKVHFLFRLFACSLLTKLCDFWDNICIFSRSGSMSVRFCLVCASPFCQVSLRTLLPHPCS